VAEWLPAVDGAVESLESGTRVLDVGCGHGGAVVLLAQAFPASTFVGIDPHEDSVAQARAAAEAAGVAERDNLDLGGVTYYGASAMACVPDALTQGADDALGGQAGVTRLRSCSPPPGSSRCGWRPRRTSTWWLTPEPDPGDFAVGRGRSAPLEVSSWALLRGGWR